MLSDAAARPLSRRPLEDDAARPVQPSRPTDDLPWQWLAGFLSPQVRDAMSALPRGTGSERGPATPDDELALARKRLDALAEIRPVSALLARIVGLSWDSSDALDRHHALCTSLQQILSDCGGPPGELLFDDKGLIFIAAFGAHGTFRRDDPRRAVDAARAITSALRQSGLDVSIGVATGDASFHVVGSAQRRQFMVLGQSVNRAARLMTSTERDILCDAPTERAVRATYQFERSGTLQLKGLGDMAPVFRPIASRRPSLTSPKLIGRQTELAFLRSTFAATRSGGNRLTVVLGAPGIGKTTLVNAFADELRGAGMTVSLSGAERNDRRTSLLAWRGVLRSLVGLPADADGNEIFRCVGERVHGMPGIAERLPLLGDALAIVTTQTEGTRHLEGAHRADATMRLVGAIVGALAPRPLTLILEDSQWLDSASWRLIEWVLSSLESLMLVLCVRAEEVPQEIKTLRRRAGAARPGTASDGAARYLRVLELAELGEASIHELVARTLSGTPPQAEITHRVAALAGGNPFFAEEIALTLKGEGLIAERDGYWRSIRPLDELRYFEGVERVIRERVDRLDSVVREVIRAMAVIGRTFSSGALLALHDGAIDEAVETLIEAQLIRPTAMPGLYEFRHSQIRDVIYASIPGGLRRQLHEALASWIESSRPDAIDAEIAVLVQHFQAAGNNEKAVKYADLAATHALQVGAFREVESFVEICLEHEPKRQLWTDEQKLRSVRWRRQLAEAHYSRGDIHAQGVAARHALSVVGNPVPQTATATWMKLIGRTVRLAVRQALPPRPELGRDADKLRWEAELARCLNQAAMVDYFEVRFSRGMCNLIGAVLHAERTGLSADTAIASSQLGCGLGMLGWRRSSDHFIGRAESAALALADPALHAHVCILDALWRLGRGEWPMVDSRIDQAQDLSLKAGDQLRWCNAQGMRFWTQYYRGDQGAWEPTTAALLSRAQNAGNVQQEIWALRCKALCLLHTDRPREAADLLRLISSADYHVIDLAARISVMGALALAYARTGRPSESIEATVETLRLLRGMPRPSSHSTIVGICGALEVLLRGREAGLAQRDDRWRSWELQALAELRRYCKVFPVGLAQLGLWTGVAHWLSGRRDDATASWQQAFMAARRFSLRRDESMIAAEMRRRLDRKLEAQGEYHIIGPEP
ncbi:ATP-binding protein [Chelatococcus reniformis]|uniref:ATP-binding protein n=1 Tax=Chelatococcus reniformis TaxID=1494448 RepID=UPI001AEE5136|nr:adenylate/guanylate cyclase domain-containing protein [Chelatococcus reniformis]